jgi:hypothetical protein
MKKKQRRPRQCYPNPYLNLPSNAKMQGARSRRWNPPPNQKTEILLFLRRCNAWLVILPTRCYIWFLSSISPTKKFKMLYLITLFFAVGCKSSAAAIFPSVPANYSDSLSMLSIPFKPLLFCKVIEPTNHILKCWNSNRGTINVWCNYHDADELNVA